MIWNRKLRGQGIPEREYKKKIENKNECHKTRTKNWEKAGTRRNNYARLWPTYVVIHTFLYKPTNALSHAIVDHKIIVKALAYKKSRETTV